ncbi:MAG TPA: 3-hydroxyacyl-CoA dehydrogenase NAD-binding domain-containing protein [Limnochordia bacterium]|nr:3-hydroxyacyl-CoA dehydrogenase NAD-binding domain-containing protein [Limnochordia bacterium]
MPYRIGVVGAGSMGAQITALALTRSLDVTLCSRRPPDEARAAVQKVLDRYAPESADALSRLRTAASPDPLAECDLVIESIIESLPEKRRLFAELDARCPAATRFASNTSVLGGAVFSELPVARRARSLVLHFFNPVFRPELIEINHQPETAAEVRAAAHAFVAALGKKPIELANINGGVVSRLVLLGINEAAHLAERGVPPERIDQAMQWGANHPMGPLRLADFVGLDVVYDNLHYLHELEGDARFKPAPLLAEHVTAGRLGRKAKRGFYVYD